MTEQQIIAEIVKNAQNMAKQIKRGKDIEIKTCNSGIKFHAVDKKVI